MPAFRKKIALFTATLAASLISAHAKAPPPNVLLILADDMGYSDAGCFGSEIETPHLDQLAAQGMRLDRFYNAGMCVTSRTSLMTGRWAHDVGFGIQKKVTTLPQALGAASYRNYLVGKWHLKGNPLDSGFHRFYGFLDGFSNFFTPSEHYRLDRGPIPPVGEDFYTTNAFADQAIQFIEQHQQTQSSYPFFTYLSFNAPHNPLQAPQAAIAKYRGRYLEGWQAIREKRFAKQKRLGLAKRDERLPPYPQNLPDWDSLTDAQRDLEDLRMATYAAMIDLMDQAIGRVINTLKTHGIYENTLILFTSDNGPDAFSVLDAPLLAQGLLPGQRGSNFQPGFGWAYAANTPLRHYKISQHEGGVASGLIASWPAGKLESGRILESNTHMVDLMPTLLEFAGVARSEFPDELAGHSFAPLLQGGEDNRERTHYFQFMDNRGLRQGPWRLSEVDGSGWELYNLDNDPNETRDLSAVHPERLKELALLWTDWWRRYHDGRDYIPESTAQTPHYSPQGDRGTGKPYHPSPMPQN